MNLDCRSDDDPRDLDDHGRELRQSSRGGLSNTPPDPGRTTDHRASLWVRCNYTLARPSGARNMGPLLWPNTPEPGSFARERMRPSSMISGPTLLSPSDGGRPAQFLPPATMAS